jgi:hypothetical protein
MAPAESERGDGQTDLSAWEVLFGVKNQGEITDLVWIFKIITDLVSIFKIITDLVSILHLFLRVHSTG